MLQYSFNWKTVSAIAGVTWWNFYFRLYPGSVRSPQVVEFLSHLMRYIPEDLLVIWGWASVSSQPAGQKLCGSTNRQD